jgi:hypothetical protein
MGGGSKKSYPKLSEGGGGRKIYILIFYKKNIKKKFDFNIKFLLTILIMNDLSHKN